MSAVLSWVRRRPPVSLPGSHTPSEARTLQEKAVPQGLKPSTAQAQCGTAEAVPFVQSFSSTCKAWISRPSGTPRQAGAV
jgi:hypothetical protein